MTPAPPVPRPPAPRPPVPLASALGALVDVPSRRASLRRRIRAAPAAAAHAIHGTLRDAMNGSTPGRDAAVVLASTLASMRADGDLPALETLREAASAQGLHAVASLLHEAPPRHALPRLGRLTEVCMRERHDLRFWPVALEHDLVRSQMRRMLVQHFPQVLAHPSPIFIARVLDRPWLQLRDVLVIAARRPTSEAIVLEIVRSDRWLRRCEVREAVVANPFAPTPLVLYLLPTTRAPVLRHLRDAGDARPEVASAAASLLDLRGAGPWAPPPPDPAPG